MAEVSLDDNFAAADAATLFLRTLLILATNSFAAAPGSSALLIPRETGISIAVPSEFMPALQACSKSPPCAPTPGANIQTLSPAALRVFSNAIESVAPTTNPKVHGVVLLF